MEPRSSNATEDGIYELTHTTTAGYVIMGVGSFVHLINLVTLCYVVYHRNYMPIKIKQVPIIVLGMIGGFIWWVGALTVLRIVAQANHSVWLLCTLWALWVQMVCGLVFFVNCLAFRIARLFIIIKLQRDISGWRGVGLFVALWCPIIVYAVVASGFEVDGPVISTYGLNMCNFKAAALYSMMAIIFGYIVLGTTLMFSLAKTKQRYLHEYQESLYSCIVFVGSFIVYLIIIGGNWQRQVWGQCVTAFIVVLVPTFFLYLSVGRPVYKCLTDHDAYEAQIISNLRNHSGQVQSNVSMKHKGTHTTAKVSDKGGKASEKTSESGSGKDLETMVSIQGHEPDPSRTEAAIDVQVV